MGFKCFFLCFVLVLILYCIKKFFIIICFLLSVCNLVMMRLFLIECYLIFIFLNIIFFFNLFMLRRDEFRKYFLVNFYMIWSVVVYIFDVGSFFFLLCMKRLNFLFFNFMCFFGIFFLVVKMECLMYLFLLFCDFIVIGIEENFFKKVF